MSLIAKSDSTGERKLPSAGLHEAVCCDVHDLGYEDTPWGAKHKILVVWELDEDHPDFEGPHRVNKKYTNSLHEKSSLGQDLESWRGKSFSAQERKEGFDLERLIGVGCQVNIIHNETDSGTWANVKAVLPLGKNQEAMSISEGYIRLKDRPDDDGSTNGSSNGKNGVQTSAKAEEPAVQDNFGAEGDIDNLPF